MGIPVTGLMKRRNGASRPKAVRFQLRTPHTRNRPSAAS